MKTPSKIFTWSFHLKSTFSDFFSKKMIFLKIDRSRSRKWNQKSKIGEFSTIGNYVKFIGVKHRFPKLWPHRWSIRSLFFWHPIFRLSPTPSHHLADAVRHPQNPGFSGFATVFERGFLQGYWTDFQNFKSFRKFTARSFTMCARFSCRFPVAFPKNCKQ